MQTDEKQTSRDPAQPDGEFPATPVAGMETDTRARAAAPSETDLIRER